MRVLKIVIPKTDVIIKYKKCFLRSFQSFNNCFRANGVNTRKATTHLQKAKDTGGIISDKLRATIKLPDHIAVAMRA